MWQQRAAPVVRDLLFRWVLRPRPEGAFSRSVTLPELFDGARVDAKYVDGVLTLTLPKHEAAKPRRVTVQTS